MKEEMDYSNPATPLMAEVFVKEGGSFNCPMMYGNTSYGKAEWKQRGLWKVCSHCGSMKPDNVISAVIIHGKGILERSTKQYKWYISLPEVKNAGDGPIKFYVPHFNEEQMDRLNDLMT
jgi:hypothetical protein